MGPPYLKTVFFSGVFTDVTDEVWPPPHVLAAQMSLIRMAKVLKGRLVGLFDEHCGLLAMV